MTENQENAVTPASADSQAFRYFSQQWRLNLYSPQTGNVDTTYRLMAAHFAQGLSLLIQVALIVLNGVALFVLPERGMFVAGVAMAILSCGFGYLSWRSVAASWPAPVTDVAVAAGALLAFASLWAFCYGALW